MRPVARRKPAAQPRSREARPRQRTRGAVRQRTGASGAAPAEPEALVVSHWLDSGVEGQPYSARVRLTGRRLRVPGVPGARDVFSREETIERIVPGSGPMSVSSWVYGLAPGEWSVTAELIRPPGHEGVGQRPGVRRRGPEPLPRAGWSWRRWAVSSVADVPVRTRWALPAPLARIPAVIPGSFTALAALGTLVALVVQSAILAERGVAVGGSLLASLLALASGLVGAKLWYKVLHPGESILRPGWAVDGFLLVAPPVAAVTLFALKLPVGLFLDATAPGLFLAVAIGRVGCFLTGCCAGHVTRSRWGVWSSDRRIGARRIPTQLLESASGLLIGAASSILVLGDIVSGQGAVFIVAVAAYLAVRQALLRLRAEARDFSWRRSRRMVGSGALQR